MSNLEISNFDVSQYLDDKEIIAEYLSQILEDGDTAELLTALGNIAKAKGMTQIAKDTGLGRESLYKTFNPNTKPKFDTIMKIINAIGVKIQVSA
jgi:probable addiction module antidote protein